MGQPRVLFEGEYLSDTSSTRVVPNYDVAPDGKRFLMVVGRSTSSPLFNLTVVVNWFEELKRRVPRR